ncbi:hypothetical protein P9112_002615 [Eukaryota sp. TZLM1-RC]
MSYPLAVQYCSRCGFPREYCEFGPSPELCNTSASSTSQSQLDNVQSEQIIEDVETSDTSPVLVGITTRGKKRRQTKIIGLGDYVSLSDASKFFRNRFACGASAEGSIVEIQGDFADDVVTLLQEEFHVPGEAISIVSEDDIKKAAISAGSKPKSSRKKKKK